MNCKYLILIHDLLYWNEEYIFSGNNSILLGNYCIVCLIFVCLMPIKYLYCIVFANLINIGTIKHPAAAYKTAI